VDMGNVPNVAEIPAASTFRVKMSMVTGWVNFSIYIYKHNTQKLPTVQKHDMNSKTISSLFYKSHMLLMQFMEFIKVVLWI
jgi:hypothetical protein